MREVPCLVCGEPAKEDDYEPWGFECGACGFRWIVYEDGSVRYWFVRGPRESEDRVCPFGCLLAAAWEEAEG